MSSHSSTTPSDKLSFKEKLIYSVGNLPGSFYGSFTGQIQAFYFAWMGLSIQWILIGQLFYGAWNLLNDPIFGVPQDRTRRKDGRYIPWIKWFSIPFTIAFILLFFPMPQWRYAVSGGTGMVALGLWYTFTLMFYDTFFTIVYLAHVAIAPQMTMDVKERTDISILNTVMGIVGMGLSAAFPLMFLTNPTNESIASFQILVIVFGVIALLPWVFIIKYIKEKHEYIPTSEMGFWDSIKCVFKNPSGRIYMVYDGISVGINNTITTVITFLFAWILGISNPYSSTQIGIVDVIPYLIVPVICFIVGMYIQLQIPKKRDVKTALMYSMIMEAIGLFICYFAIITSSNLSPTVFVQPNNLWMVSIGLSIMLFGFSGDFFYHNVMRADTIDYDEVLSGERRESVYAGVGCLLSKPMISVALAVVPAILSVYGLAAASPDDPTSNAMVVNLGYDQAVIGVATAGFLFPAILAVIGIIFWLFYPLDRKKLEEVHTILDELHAKKRENRLNSDGSSKFTK